jgi:hypothetical protein
MKCKYCQCSMPRGSYRIILKHGRNQGYCCRSVLGCYNRIKKQRDLLLKIGTQMASVFFNISQRSTQLHPTDNVVFGGLYATWDAAKREGWL